jgi:hypothetical protein
MLGAAAAGGQAGQAAHEGEGEHGWRERHAATTSVSSTGMFLSQLMLRRRQFLPQVCSCPN